MPGHTIAGLLFGLVVVFAGPTLASEVAMPADWVIISAGKAFTFKAPADTVRYTDGGMAIDSFVRMYRNSQFTLMFDYGQWSNDLSGFKSKPGYVFDTAEIDGRKATVVTGPGGNSWGCNDYMSAVYLIVSHSWWSGRTIRLEMSGCTKDPKNLPLLHKVFESLHFSES